VHLSLVCSSQPQPRMDASISCFWILCSYAFLNLFLSVLNLISMTIIFARAPFLNGTVSHLATRGGCSTLVQMLAVVIVAHVMCLYFALTLASTRHKPAMNSGSIITPYFFNPFDGCCCCPLTSSSYVSGAVGGGGSSSTSSRPMAANNVKPFSGSGRTLKGFLKEEEVTTLV
jgi:hypothetical protein